MGCARGREVEEVRGAMGPAHGRPEDSKDLAFTLSWMGVSGELARGDAMLSQDHGC